MVFWCDLDPERPAASFRRRAAPPRTDGPLCRSLLDEFAGVMLVPDRHPRHLCKTVAGESLRRWRRTSGIERAVGGSNGTDQETLSGWRDSWPLTIGRAALAHDAKRRSLPALEVLAPALPFDGHERALFAATAELDGFNLEVFGLAELVDRDGAGRDVCTLSKLAWRLRGVDYPRDEPEALKVLRSARRWWNERLSGQTMRGSPRAGRPKGSYKGVRRSAADVEQWYREALYEYDTPPTLSDLADFFGVSSARTVKARLDQLGLGWPPC